MNLGSVTFSPSLTTATFLLPFELPEKLSSLNISISIIPEHPMNKKHSNDSDGEVTLSLGPDLRSQVLDSPFYSTMSNSISKCISILLTQLSKKFPFAFNVEVCDVSLTFFDYCRRR